MTGRLVSPPLGLGLVSVEPLSSPRTIGAAKGGTIGNFTQTVSSPFGAWHFSFAFHAMRDAEFRDYRGWVTSMQGGANATRWVFHDPDMRNPFESGIDVSPHVRWDNIPGQNWSNDEPWSNGEAWAVSPPVVSVSAATALGGTRIQLAPAYWGHLLRRGEYIGFFPFHFGLYVVTEVIAPGQYRIWPPLRKALTLGDMATLCPTLAMRLDGEDAATAARGLVVADGLSVSMVEVFDYDVRDWFTG
ncbi:hypothetical protein JYP46_19360 [Nitratireductor aquimarinus]|uniref:hypothetical protein n=1 Tax=Alphaproteobacteria TaxID=28211 RepID=UPI0019D4064A|nr:MULTISPECIES: hypothetical protein [Alphaproteobacteria]MBN7758991.1 hypothetical protein [Nitratireductor aquimarinus]MBY6001664.1 hypothetical protein [Tritonibacter mobilis]MBY6023952.1 hypothetical protein [Nitratireductor sp. DP7N14-4]